MLLVPGYPASTMGKHSNLKTLSCNKNAINAFCPGTNTEGELIMSLSLLSSSLLSSSSPLLHLSSPLYSIHWFIYHNKVLLHCLFKGEQSVDPVNAYFVLNPENNLPNTQKIFQNWFER